MEETQHQPIRQLEGLARLFTIPREPARQLIQLLLDYVFDVEVFGVEKIPMEGGGVIICNHTDYMDVLIQGTYSPRKIIFLGKNELFEADKEIKKFLYQEGSPLNLPIFALARPLLDQAIEAYAFAQRTQFLEWGGYPVMRNFRGDSAKAAVAYYQDLEDYMVGLLKEGKLLSVYPEGTRSEEHEGLKPFKALAAKIAIRAGVPVIPSAIKGAHGFTSIWSVLSGKVFQQKIRFRVGDPIYPEEFPKDGDLKKQSKELTKRLQSTVETLLEDLS